MSIPTHHPFCQTKTYPTSCRYCGQNIFVLQCTCDSVVLFDALGAPWPQHICAQMKRTSEIGGSGLSGWEVADILRAQGAPITSDIIKTIFPGGAQSGSNAKSEPEIRRIDPLSGKEQSFIAVVRELASKTNRTEAVEILPELGRKLLGLDPKEHYRQITLVANDKHPNESFTALIPTHLARNLKTHVMVTSEISGRVSGSSAYWVVTDIKPL